MNYEIGRTPRILVGTEHLSSLGAILKKWERASAVLILDPSLSSGEYIKNLKEHLKTVTIAEYTIPEGEPTVDGINTAAIYARSFPRAVIIGVGGGSAIDFAKQVAAIVASFEGIEHYLLAANPFMGRRQIIAIPSTSGTGAEVMRTSFVSDMDGRKTWTYGEEMLPDLVILDPNATLGLPDTLVVQSALGALAQAFEAITSQHQNAVSSSHAVQAIKLIYQHLPEVSNVETRAKLQEAALLAGFAADNAGAGVAQDVVQALGTLYQIPYREAITVALEATLAWNLEGLKSYSSIAEIFGVKPTELPNAVKQLLEQVKFSVSNIAKLEPQAIANVMNAPENQAMLENNARVVNTEARLELAMRVVKVWDGYKN